MDNGDYSPYENGHLGDMSRLEKSPLLANGYNQPPHMSHMPFMQLPHPAAAHSALLSPGMPHNLARPDGSVIKNEMPSMEAIARSGIWENCRAAYEDIVKHLERLREDRGNPDRPLPLDQKARELGSRGGSPNTSPVLNLSKNASGGSAGSPADGEHSGSEPDGPDGAPSPRSPTHSGIDDEDDDNISDPEDDDDKDQDLDDGDLPLPTAPGSDSQQTALNYSTLASAVASVNGPGQGSTISSTETLLRNIQGLLKVAAENARQQERQINYEKAELKMDVLREREVKDSLERQLADEQKIRALIQKRLRRERRARRRLQDQIELEVKRRIQLEDALKAAGAGDQIRIINDKLAQQTETQQQQQQRTTNKTINNPTSNQGVTNERERTERNEHSEKERVESPTTAFNQNMREPPPPDVKPWGYAGVDLMNTGAAFWQNYSDSLAQELEMERKSRHQQVDRDVKPSLQERSNYYKNSVLFTSTAT